MNPIVERLTARIAAAAPAAQPPRAPRQRPCVHLGAEARQVQCATCGGRVLVRVFACALYAEATLAKPLAGVRCCQTCPSYEPRS